MDTTARLLITCPDKAGIIAAVTGFLHKHGGNITFLNEHATAPEGGTFFMRLEFETPHLTLRGPALEQAFGDVVADRFEMAWRISYAVQKGKTALLVSKQEHAVLELLWRWRRGELHTDVSMVIANHDTLRDQVESFGVPFHVVSYDGVTREAAEAEMLELLEGQADLVVLARFMRVLSGEFVSHFPNRMINIHHSFLPAFAGANPYQQAYERGVKLIGATAHYVTDQLDEGPIIEQGVARASHKDRVQQLRACGRDLERQVLARAVRWHLEDRIIVDGQKTVVFA
jgi:formyltetrahydrofolate deformylase